MGKSWSSPTQQELPVEPKGSLLDQGGDNNQQSLVHLIVEHNIIACNELLLEGYNGNAMKIMLKPIKWTTIVTTPQTLD